MIDYEKAKSAAKDYFWKKSSKQLACALDAEGFWIFYGGDKYKTEYGGTGIKISKDTGEIFDFYLPDDENFELLEHAVKINL